MAPCPRTGQRVGSRSAVIAVQKVRPDRPHAPCAGEPVFVGRTTQHFVLSFF